MRDGQLTINGRPTWVKSTEPLVNDGLEVGDIWVDLFVPTTKRCTAITPTVTFTEIEGSGGAGGAPTTAKYITQTPDSGLSAEQALSALDTGLLKNTTTTGVLSIAVGDTDYTLPATTALKAPLASPTFTGSVALPTSWSVNGTTISATATELNYMVGVTSAVQTQLNSKAGGTGTANGTNTGDQTITLTGGVTGSGTGSFVATVVTNANLTGVVTSTGNATAIANGAITNAMLANSAVANLSGSNSGDQSSIVGITGTKAQFNTACTDGDFLYVGDVSTPNVFNTIAVSGQSNVVADSSTDTLTLVAGSNITITTDAGTDSITITGTGGGSGLTQPQVMAIASMRI